MSSNVRARNHSFEVGDGVRGVRVSHAGREGLLGYVGRSGLRGGIGGAVNKEQSVSDRKHSAATAGTIHVRSSGGGGSIEGSANGPSSRGTFGGMVSTNGFCGRMGASPTGPDTMPVEAASRIRPALPSGSAEGGGGG